MNEPPVVSTSRPRDAVGKFGPAQQLENLWRQGQSPDVREYLSGQENLTPAQVVAVLCVDQCQRWHHGERVPAETYLKTYPALATAWADAFELISSEFHLRQELGEKPDLQDFLHRFPQYTAKLQRLDPSQEYSSVPYTAINTPGDVISTAGDVVLDPRVISEWPTVPGYKVLGKLGQGGMGQVFKARQERLGRLVALKIIRKEHLSQDPAAIHRFQLEAQTAAQLSHPNIIVIYDFNQHGDTYYIAMEYVEGVDLHNFVQDFGPLRPEMAAEYMCQLALGLQHAFEQGMVHRDIKPSNLMVALPKMEAPNAFPTGPPTLDQLRRGIVKILDLGTALITHAADSESAKWTKQGALMGTPDYLAPEQAVDSHTVDIRADLYSVGCTFYYLLTGKPPFGEFPLMKKLMMHQTAEPRPVRDIQADVPTSLEAVVRRLLAKRPEDRYQTPGELAEALTPQPVQKKRSGLQALATIEFQRPAIASPSTTVERSDSSTPIKIAGPPPSVNIKRPRKAEAELPAGVEWAKTIAIIEGHTSWVVALAFSPDRNLLASAAVQGNVRLWDFSSPKPNERSSFQAASKELHSLVYAADRTLLAAGSGSLDGTVWLWDVMQPMPAIKHTLEGHRAPIEALAFSSDSKLLATGSCDKTIRVWDLNEKGPAERAVYQGHGDHVKTLAFLPDGKTLVSGSLDGTLRLWRKGGFWARDQVAMLQGRWGAVQSVAVAPDGKALAFGALDQTVRLWSLAGEEPNEAAVLHGHPGVIRQILFPPDGKTLVSICDAGRIILWNIMSAAKLREWQLPQAHRCSYTFTLDGRYVATGLSDGTVQVFRLYPKKSPTS